MEQEKGIEGLRKSFEDFKRTQLDIDSRMNNNLSQISNDLGKVARGIYGDKENDQPGVLDRLNEDERRIDDLEKRVKKIEERQYKMWVWGVGALAVIDIVWTLFKDKFLR